MFHQIIIVDTRVELPIKYKKALENHNTSVFIANNLMDAYKFIQENEPDLIIISDNIPEKQEEFINKIRVLTYNMRPIIVGISKSAELDDKIKLLENGADDFISEPINIEEFKTRIKAHLRRELESNLDNKSLLPNKRIAIRFLNRTIRTSDDWAVLLVSVEHLRQYSEIYTELAGDKVIQAFVAIIKSALSEEDFLSHISDNEFLIITHPISAEKIASFLTFAFDTVAPKFYSEEDAKRGYTLLQGDEFAGVRVPLLSVNIGVVLSEFDKFSDINKLIPKLYQVKNLSKIPFKSNYIIDRPKISAENAINPQGVNNKIAIIEKDEALELLLKTTFELQGYEVIYDLHQIEYTLPSIIIIDANDDLSGLELCSSIKYNRKFVHSKVIVTSTHHDKTNVLNSGADLYIPKPYEMSTIIKWVEYLFNEVKNNK